MDIESEINIKLEENCHHKTGITSETCKRQDKVTFSRAS